MTSGLRFVFGSDIGGPDWEDAVRGCGWRFVRGGSQLALYEESRKPTGHVMTALGGLDRLRPGHCRRGH